MSQPAEWHEARRKGLGGSDIAAALGVSPWKTQLELWGEKTGLAPSSFDGNEATEWGSKMENLLMEKYEEVNTDHRVLVQDSVSHKDYPFMRANVDGVIVDRSEGVRTLGVWEGKTSQNEWTEVPVNYQLQVQHYMFVLDLPFAIISVLFHGNMYREFRIERDPAYETDLLPQLEAFWKAVDSKMPVFEATNMEDLNIKYGGVATEVAQLSDVSEYADAIGNIVAAKVALAKAKGDFDRQKIKLAENMLSDKLKTITVNGKSVATIVTVGSSVAFDMVKFKKREPDMHHAYLTKTRKGYTSLRVTS